VPHLRVPALDHELVSLIWAVALGAFIYFGSVAVGIHDGTAFILAAVSAFFIVLFVRYCGEDQPGEDRSS
jgi:hypothetical protein